MFSNPTEQKSKYQLYEEMKHGECSSHGSSYQSVCCEPRCADSNTSFLCSYCLDDHPSQHKILSLSYVFSDELLEDLKKYKSVIERDKTRQSSITSFSNMGDLFENIERKVLRMLQESRQKFKNFYSQNFPDLLTLEEFQNELIDFMREDISSKYRIKSYIKGFGEKMTQFTQIRKSFAEKPKSISVDITSIAEAIRIKLFNLETTIEKFIEEELDPDATFKKKAEKLEFFNRSSKTLFSSQNIEDLQLNRTFTTNHSSNWLSDILLLKDSMFVTCSYDSTIRIWNFGKTIPEKILLGHSDFVNNIIMLKCGKLCSASTDRTIRIWDLQQGCEISVFRHLGAVLTLVELQNDILIGGGVDEIRFWNLKPSRVENGCIRIIQNKGVCQSIVLLNHDEIACGSNEDISIFKISGQTRPLKKLVGHTRQVWHLLWDAKGSQLISSGLDSKMRMWDVRKGSCTRVLKGNHLSYCMTWFKENVVVTSYHNGEMKFWNICNGRCIKTLVMDGGAYKLKVKSNGELVSSGLGNRLAFWGEF